MAQVKRKPGYYTYRDYRCWPEYERWELAGRRCLLEVSGT